MGRWARTLRLAAASLPRERSRSGITRDFTRMRLLAAVRIQIDGCRDHPFFDERGLPTL